LGTTEGEPKIGDFGLSKRLDTATGRTTKRGILFGTPNYLAPELLSGGPGIDHRAGDIYALGAILYECLTGRPPFRGATVVDTTDQIRHQRVIAPRWFDRHVPIDLEAICLKCLERKPSRRYASARETADDLRRWLKNEPTLAVLPGPVRRTLDWAGESPALALVAAWLIATYLFALIFTVLYFAR
jgi:serine/threonine protein kinase